VVGEHSNAVGEYKNGELFCCKLCHENHPKGSLCRRQQMINPRENHLFLTWDFFGQIWYEIYNWLELVSVKSVHVKDNILQFRSLGGFSKNIFLFDQLSCVWTIWRDMNAKFFNKRGFLLINLWTKLRCNPSGGQRKITLILLLITTLMA